MIQIKKLKRPSKKSGKRLAPGEVSEFKSLGLTITNTSKSQVYYVDRVKEKRK